MAKEKYRMGTPLDDRLLVRLGKKPLSSKDPDWRKKNDDDLDAQLDAMTSSSSPVEATAMPAQPPTKEGEVVAIGLGRRKEDGSRVPMNVKVGDRVLVNNWAGDTIKLGKEELLIARDDSIMMKLPS